MHVHGYVCKNRFEFKFQIYRACNDPYKLVTKSGDPQSLCVCTIEMYTGCVREYVLSGLSQHLSQSIDRLYTQQPHNMHAIPKCVCSQRL